jgi:uncharacterized protein YjbJ (UPF0337 family)
MAGYPARNHADGESSGRPGATRRKVSWIPGTHGKQRMKRTEIRGDWKATKVRILQKWPSLSEDDLRHVAGEEDALIGRIQKRVGLSRETVEKAVRELSAVR